MSFRCAIGWHDYVLAGTTWLGLYEHANCPRCGTKFSRPAGSPYWTKSER